MTPPRRCAPMAVRFTPEQLSSLRRNHRPVLPEYTLCHSRKQFVVAYHLESLEMVLDAHRRALNHF